MFLKLTLGCLILCLTICKPLTKEVLDYLDKDKETFATYKDNYKILACKLITYSKLKYLYDIETIDKYLNQTDDKMGFLNLAQSKMIDMCVDKNDNNMVLREIYL